MPPPEPRSAEEWVLFCVQRGHRPDKVPWYGLMCVNCARAFAAQECAAREGWLIEKLKQLRAYAVPTDGRSTWEEIQGWTHRLIFVHDQFNELIRERATLQATLTEAQKSIEIWKTETDRVGEQRDALQQRVEALEKAGAEILAFVRAMRGSQHHTVVALEAALRGGETEFG